LFGKIPRLCLPFAYFLPRLTVVAGGCGRRERYLNDTMQPRPPEILLAQNSLSPSFSARLAFVYAKPVTVFGVYLISCPFSLFRCV
ncbi:MAG: hypothetical protein ACTTKL_11245, partial [Treponema sp.]